MSDRYVRAEITRWVDSDPQPGIVECCFEDASSCRRSFIGKYYDFTDEDLRPESPYPQAGRIVCAVVSRWSDAQGRELAEIEIGEIKSWRAHESIDGHSRFVILADLLENG